MTDFAGTALEYETAGELSRAAEYYVLGAIDAVRPLRCRH